MRCQFLMMMCRAKTHTNLEVAHRSAWTNVTHECYDLTHERYDRPTIAISVYQAENTEILIRKCEQ